MFLCLEEQSTQRKKKITKIPLHIRGPGKLNYEVSIRGRTTFTLDIFTAAAVGVTFPWGLGRFNVNYRVPEIRSSSVGTESECVSNRAGHSMGEDKGGLILLPPTPQDPHESVSLCLPL